MLSVSVREVNHLGSNSLYDDLRSLYDRCGGETMIGMAGFELQAPRGSGLCSIAVLTSVAWRRRSEPESQLP